MTRAAIAMGLAALLAGAGAAADDEPGASARGAGDLVGGYTIVSGEKFGEKEPAGRIEGTTVRITEKEIVVTTRDKKEAYASTYELDTGRTPWRITMTSKLAPSEGQVARGLIEKRGDTVRIIYALPGGETPTGFKTKEKRLMFVMENKNK